MRASNTPSTVRVPLTPTLSPNERSDAGLQHRMAERWCSAVATAVIARAKRSNPAARAARKPKTVSSHRNLRLDCFAALAMTREKTADLAPNVTQTFRTGFEQPLKFLFFRNRFRIILPSSRPDGRASALIVSASGQDATGPSRCRPNLRRGDEPRRRKGDDRRRGRTAQAVQQYGYVLRIWSSEPGAAPAGIRQAVNPARAERRRRLRLWSGSTQRWAGPPPCANASAYGFARMRQAYGCRGRGLSPSVPHALSLGRGSKTTGEPQAGQRAGRRTYV